MAKNNDRDRRSTTSGPGVGSVTTAPVRNVTVRPPAKGATGGVGSKPSTGVYAIRAGDRTPVSPRAERPLPPRSLSESVSGGRTVNDSQPARNPDARPNTSLRVSALKLSVPDRVSVSRTLNKPALPNTDTKSTRPARSDPVPRDQVTCKARPENNKPKKGGGSGKSFVPWCK